MHTFLRAITLGGLLLGQLNCGIILGLDDYDTGVGGQTPASSSGPTATVTTSGPTGAQTGNTTAQNSTATAQTTNTGSTIASSSSGINCPDPCQGGDCSSGTCVCPAPRHLCGGNCVANDAQACGPNCIQCPAGESCLNDVCGCPDSSACPAGQACNPVTHKCSVNCDGFASFCNGGCCQNGVCHVGVVPGACGVGGLTCAPVCWGHCSSVPEWAGGSCECFGDETCNGISAGPKCLGSAVMGTGVCGCLSDADCVTTNHCKLGMMWGGPAGYCAPKPQ